jgi:WD40 repeat protein
MERPFVPGPKITVRLWEMATGRELKRLTVDAANLLPLAFSPDGKLVAAGGYDHIIHLWNPSTGEEVGPGIHDFLSYGWLTFLPGGKSLISKSRRDDKFTFWDPLTGKEKEPDAFGKPDAWTISNNGKVLAVLGLFPPYTREASIRLWDLTNKRELGRFKPSMKKVRDLELSSDGTLLAAGGDDSLVQIWNVSTGKEVKTMGQDLGMNDKWRLSSLSFSPDGAMLVVKRRARGPVVLDGMDPRWPSETFFCDLSSGKKLGRFEKFRRWCDWVVFSPDSKTMVTTTEFSEYHLCFWEIATVEELRTVENQQKFLAATFSPDGRTLATGIEDGLILILEVATGKVRRTLKGHRGPVGRLAFSDDGLLLVSESSDGTALVWDLYNRFMQVGNKLP